MELGYNPYDALYKFIKDEFESSDLKGNYNFYELNIYDAKEIFATINPKKDSDRNIDKLKEILSKDKNFDESTSSLSDDQIQRAIKIKKLFDEFITKYKDKADVFYNTSRIEIFISIKKHSSNPILIIKDKESDKQDDECKKYINKAIIPALKYAKEKNGISKPVDEKDIKSSIGGSDKDFFVKFSIKV